MERENFSSRLGFILISAGCAIGLVTYGVFHLLQACTERLFRTYLSIFPAHSRIAYHGSRIFSRPCQLP